MCLPLAKHWPWYPGGNGNSKRKEKIFKLWMREKGRFSKWVRSHVWVLLLLIPPSRLSSSASSTGVSGWPSDCVSMETGLPGLPWIHPFSRLWCTWVNWSAGAMVYKVPPSFGVLSTWFTTGLHRSIILWQLTLLQWCIHHPLIMLLLLLICNLCICCLTRCSSV